MNKKHQHIKTRGSIFSVCVPPKNPLLPLVLILLVFAPVQAWLDGWDYRRPIEVNTITNLTNYQIVMNITYDSNMKADFSDIRFVAPKIKVEIQNSLASALTDYQVKIENPAFRTTQNYCVSDDDSNCNVNYVVIEDGIMWIKTTISASNTKTIYIWQDETAPAGNSSAVFDFFDDFDGTSLKSYWGTSGTPTVSGGTVSLDNNDIICATGSAGWGSGYIFEAKAKADEQDTKFLQAGDSVALDPTNLLAIINSDGLMNDVFNKFSLQPGNVESNTAYDFRHLYHIYGIHWISSSSVKFYQDDIYLGEVTSSIPTVDLYPNFAVFDNSQSSTLTVDWVRVRKYATTEPTVTVTYDTSGELGTVPYWIEDKVNSSWAYVWVKGSWYNTNGTQIYLYYGNSGATSGSNGTATFAFFDGWGTCDIEKYTVVSGTYSCNADGTLEITSIATSYPYATALMTDLTDFVVNMKVNSTYSSLDGSWQGISARYQDIDNSYYMLFDRNDDGVKTGKEVSGSLSNSANSITYSTTTNIWYNYEARIYGNNLTSCVDGNCVSNTETDFSYGSMGLNGRFTNQFFKEIRVRKYNQIEPTYSISSEEESGDKLYFNETSPHIFQLVNISVLNTTDQLVNGSNFRWDFGDGSTSTTSTPYIVNAWSNGGTYNVSVVYNNGTADVLVWKELSVFEPTVTITLNDTETSTLLSDFSVVFSQGSTEKAFSTNTTSLVLNVTDLDLWGNVSVLALKPAYNTTTETIFIDYENNVVKELEAKPAKIIIYSEDYDYTNVTVPSEVTISNSTKTVSKVSSLVSTSLLNIHSYNNIAFSDTFTSEQDQMFKYQLNVSKGSSSYSNDYVYSIAYLCDQDGNNCVELTNIGETSSSAVDESETRYLYVSKSGTYKLLYPNATVEKTGSFAYFPVRLKTEVKAYSNSGVSNARAKAQVWQTEPFIAFFDSDFLTGNVSMTVQQSTDGFFGYLDNTYSDVKFADYVSIYDYINKTAYMVSSSDTYTLKAVVYDSANQGVEDAKVVIYRLDSSGNLVEIGSAFTDGFGSTSYFNLKRDSTVYIIASKGSQTTVLYKKYVDTNNDQVILVLGEEATVTPITLPFESVLVEMLPEELTLTESTDYWFNATVVDTDSSLVNGTVCLWANSSYINFSYCDVYTSPSGFIWSQNLSAIDVNYTLNIYFTVSLTKEVNSTYYFYTKEKTYTMMERTGLFAIPDLVDDLGYFKNLFSAVIIISSLVAFRELGLFISAVVLFMIGMIDAIVLIASIVLSLALRYGAI